jgi:hypothetical protein
VDLFGADPDVLGRLFRGLSLQRSLGIRNAFPLLENLLLELRDLPVVEGLDERGDLLLVAVLRIREPGVDRLRNLHRRKLVLTPPVLLDEVFEVERAFGSHHPKVLAPVAFDLGGVAHHSTSSDYQRKKTIKLPMAKTAATTSAVHRLLSNPLSELSVINIEKNFVRSLSTYAAPNRPAGTSRRRPSH